MTRRAEKFCRSESLNSRCLNRGLARIMQISRILGFLFTVCFGQEYRDRDIRVLRKSFQIFRCRIFHITPLPDISPDTLFSKCIAIVL